VSSLIPTLTRAQIAHLKKLFRDKQARQTNGTFIVEGAKSVRDLLRSFSGHVHTVVTTPTYRIREAESDRELRESVSVRHMNCPEPAFASLSDVEAPQGILAVVQRPVWDEGGVVTASPLFGVFGERIQDPLNVGTIIRTAAALGVSALWLTPDSADPFHPKVVRATGGALLSFPIFQVPDVTGLVRAGCAIIAAEAHGPATVPLDSITSIPVRSILAVGNEGNGLSTQLRDVASHLMTIPLGRGIDSLNVAATVAIATYHLMHLPKTS